MSVNMLCFDKSDYRTYPKVNTWIIVCDNWFPDNGFEALFVDEAIFNKEEGFGNEYAFSKVRVSTYSGEEQELMEGEFWCYIEQKSKEKRLTLHTKHDKVRQIKG